MIKLGLTEVSLSLGVRQLATWCYSVVEYVGRGSDLEARASRDWSLDLLLTSCVINSWTANLSVLQNANLPVPEFRLRGF